MVLGPNVTLAFENVSISNIRCAAGAQISVRRAHDPATRLDAPAGCAAGPGPLSPSPPPLPLQNARRPAAAPPTDRPRRAAGLAADFFVGSDGSRLVMADVVRWRYVCTSSADVVRVHSSYPRAPNVPGKQQVAARDNYCWRGSCFPNHTVHYADVRRGWGAGFWRAGSGGWLSVERGVWWLAGGVWWLAGLAAGPFALLGAGRL